MKPVGLGSPSITKVREQADVAEPKAETPAPKESDAFQQPKKPGLLDRIFSTRTHERVIGEVKGTLLGLEVGVTFSELESQKTRGKGFEVVQVVAPDGSANIETVLWNKELGAKQRLELQGPALNTSVTPGELPISGRIVGLGLTSDLSNPGDPHAVSYTAEVKLTTTSLLKLAAAGGKGAAKIAAKALTAVAGRTAGRLIAKAVIGAVPIVSAGLAVLSARRAVKTMRDPNATTQDKAFAVAHAVADAVRVVLPITGTIADAALTVAQAAMKWVELKHAVPEPA